MCFFYAVIKTEFPIKSKRGNFSGKRKDDNRRERAPRREVSEFDKQVVQVRRVQKVVKGGRTLRFSALVVVGDRKGRVGIGIGKSKEVSAAIEKATTVAKKNVVNIPIVDNTIPHNTIGKYSATSIMLLPAPEGTGVIAGGSARAVIELAGIKNIVTRINEPIKIILLIELSILLVKHFCANKNKITR